MQFFIFLSIRIFIIKIKCVKFLFKITNYAIPENYKNYTVIFKVYIFVLFELKNLRFLPFFFDRLYRGL